MKHFHLIWLALATVLSAGGAQAEVQKFIRSCDGKLCPYYRIALTPPDGWVIDEGATKKNDVQIIVPKGKTFGNAPALIYVQVFYHRDKQQSLANFAETSNERWRAGSKTPRYRRFPPSNAPTANRVFCASPSRIRARRNRPTRSEHSASIPTRTAMNSYWISS